MAKCANFYAVAKTADYLYPVQLGVGVSGVCEAAVHAARRFAVDIPEGWSLVKLDFKNALSCLSRKKMLNSVHLHLPELYNYCCSCYSGPSYLRYGSRIVESREGVLTR